MVLSSAFAVGGPLSGYDKALEQASASYHLRLAGSSHMFSADVGAMPFVPASAKGEIPTLPTGLAPGAPARSGGTVSAAGTLQISLPLVGPLDAARGLTITRAYANAFFGQYLLDTKSPLLDGPSAAYLEITFEGRSVRDQQ